MSRSVSRLKSITFDIFHKSFAVISLKITMNNEIIVSKIRPVFYPFDPKESNLIYYSNSTIADPTTITRIVEKNTNSLLKSKFFPMDSSLYQRTSEG